MCRRWLIELLGLPAQASFALVTGCQMAHFTCLAAARNGLLAAHAWDVEQQGLFGAPPLRVVTSDQRHGTVERALRMLGLGRGCLLELPSDARGQLQPAALEPALASQSETPSIVVLQAGDVNTGAFDSFPELIEVAHRRARGSTCTVRSGSGQPSALSTGASRAAWSSPTPGRRTDTSG